jgi:hypothetical protein
MMSVARYLVFVLALFVALCAAAGAYAWSEMGRFTRSGYASCAYIDKKVALGGRTPSPKFVVVAGSNAALGIHVRTVSEALSVPGFNFALVATFSPGFQLFEARKILKPGDAVLIASEYLAYDYGSPTNALVDAVYSCGEDYWRSLDWPRRLFFVLAVRPQRVIDTLRFNKANAARADRAVVRDVTADGDEARTGTPGLIAGAQTGAHQPLVIRFGAQSNGVGEIENFLAWAKANGVTVFATWPNTLYFPQYKTYPAFGEIADFYRAHGVEMIGAPEDSMFGEKFLADTIYHLNADGIRLRTEKLIANLKADSAFLSWAAQAKVAQARAKRANSSTWGDHKN